MEPGVGEGEGVEDLHPLDAHCLRKPVPATAGVRVVVLSEVGEERAREIGQELRRLIAGRLRPVEVVVDWYPHSSRAERLARAIEGAREPLTLVTTASEPWREDHLDPLLKAIDRSDHVIGGRRKGVVAWLRSRPWRLLFAVPVLDVHSPCALHRTEALQRIPLQSSSDFLDIEILAKATFLGHLLEETPVPVLEGKRAGTGFLGDLVDVLRQPRFRFSSPAEDAEGEVEGDQGPGGQDREVAGDVEKPRPLEDDSAQSVDELREG